MANTDLTLTTSIKVNPTFQKSIDKVVTTITKVNPTMIHDITKTLTSSSIKINPTIQKTTGKNVTTITKINPVMVHDIGKNVTTTTKVNPVIRKNIDKIITTSVKVTATKQINAATLTLWYNGNFELGLGSEKGSLFEILVTGTFTVFSITCNGKTLTYTESVTAQTITIDNINATCKNGTTNKMSKLTGDTTEFLKLLPGANVISYTKTGGNVDFNFNFRQLYV